MPILKRDNAVIHFEETGSGSPLMLLHGFSVTSAYWSKPGVTGRLARRYRVIAPDLRGHGRTHVNGAPLGFDADTMVEDIHALAAALAMERFHLVGHSMGGMVAVRYALRYSPGLLSLTLIGTGSATAFGAGDPRLRRQGLELFAQLYERFTWDQLFAHLRSIPGPLLYHLNFHPERERLWGLLEEISRENDPKTLGAFARSFFTDPDPRLEELRRIQCPTLVLLGDHDKLFISSSAELAREIPQARQVLMSRVGHMTALETPERTSQEILAFLAELP